MNKRFFGLDLHKKYATICGIGQQGHVVLREERLHLDQLPTWAARTLRPSDAVALEATANTVRLRVRLRLTRSAHGEAWWAYDCLAAHAGRVVVVNPLKTRLIAEARINTDERSPERSRRRLSAEALARLLESNFIVRLRLTNVCEVWVPDERTRRYRQLISHHIRLAQEATRLKNRIHAILHRHQIRSPYRDLFTCAGRAWLQRIDLPEVEKLLTRQNLQLLKTTEEALAEMDQLLARLAQDDERVPILMQIPGINVFTALAILAETSS